jgi:hypothetical protein
MPRRRGNSRSGCGDGERALAVAKGLRCSSRQGRAAMGVAGGVSMLLLLLERESDRDKSDRERDRERDRDRERAWDRQHSLVEVPGYKEVVVGQRRRQHRCRTSVAEARTGVLA